jgi:hypothetical protein
VPEFTGLTSSFRTDDEVFLRHKWEVWRGRDVPLVLEVKGTMPEWQDSGGTSRGGKVLIMSSTSTTTTDKSIILTVTYQFKITYVRGGLGQVLNSNPWCAKHFATWNGGWF